MDYSNYKYMDSLFLEEYKAMDNLDVFSEDELRVIKVNNATVLPCKNIDGKKYAGVLDNKGKYVELSAFEALSPVDCWGGSYEISDTIAYIDEKVMYMGRFWRHWGHFIMDLVSRLWYVVEVDKSIKIVYDANADISGVYLEFMRLLGIEENRLIRVDEPTRFRSVIVPECSHKPGISCNVRYKNIFDTVCENALMESNLGNKYADAKIYFTRTGLNLRFPLEAGEKDIEKLFMNNDYLIVSPEKYSLVEQVVMLRQAKEIACVAGTLPHNMMFANDGASLIVIRKTNKPNYRQTDVNQIRKLKVTNIDAHISPFAVGAAGPFILDVNNNVKNFFEDRNMKFKYSRFLRFWKIKGRMLWYIPLYFARNKGKKPNVPLFDGKQFSTRDTAKKELFRYYFKRI